MRIKKTISTKRRRAGAAFFVLSELAMLDLILASYAFDVDVSKRIGQISNELKNVPKMAYVLEQKLESEFGKLTAAIEKKEAKKNNFSIKLSYEEMYDSGLEKDVSKFINDVFTYKTLGTYSESFSNVTQYNHYLSRGIMNAVYNDADILEILTRSLIVAESWGKLDAKPKKGKERGLLQILEYIGKSHGLRIDKKVDERNHPIALEKAGIPILDSYMNRYRGNVILTIIAYNAGQDKADNIISKYGPAPKWEEIKGELSNVTRKHVAKTLALMELYTNADHYGMAIMQQPLFDENKYDEAKKTTETKAERVALLK